MTGSSDAEMLDSHPMTDFDDILPPGGNVAHAGLLPGAGPIGMPPTPTFLWDFALGDVKSAGALRFAAETMTSPTHGEMPAGIKMACLNQYQAAGSNAVDSRPSAVGHKTEMQASYNMAHFENSEAPDGNEPHARPLAGGWPTEWPPTPPFSVVGLAPSAVAPRQQQEAPKNVSKRAQMPRPAAAELSQRAKNRQGQKPGWPQAKKFHDRRCGGGAHDPGCRIMDPQFVEDVQRLERTGMLWKK